MSSVKNGNLLKGTQSKRKREEDQKVKLNPALAPPYAQKFPDIQKHHQRMILEEMKSVFNITITDQMMSKKKRKLMKKRPNDTPEKIDEILKSIFSKKEEYTGKDLHQLVLSLNDSSKLQTAEELREYAILGISDITRYIKKGGELHLIMCSDSRENWNCQNILCQALLANIPVCSINGLSDVLCQSFSIGNVAAIAFKKTENSPFKDLAEFVIDKIPDVHSPWIKMWKGRYSNTETENTNEDTNICSKTDTISASNEAANIISGIKVTALISSKIVENTIDKVNRTENIKKSRISDDHNGKLMSSDADENTQATANVLISKYQHKTCDMDGKTENTKKMLVIDEHDEKLMSCDLGGKTQTVEKMEILDVNEIVDEKSAKKVTNGPEYLKMNIVWKENKRKTSEKKVKQMYVNKNKNEKTY